MQEGNLDFKTSVYELQGFLKNVELRTIFSGWEIYLK